MRRASFHEMSRLFMLFINAKRKKGEKRNIKRKNNEKETNKITIKTSFFT